MRSRTVFSALLLVIGVGIPDAQAAVGDAARVRSSSHYLQLVIYEALDRSITFRRLVADIEQSDGIVYVEPGVCRHGVRSCLSMSVVSASGFRLLRIVVDPSRSPWDLMEAIGHELPHATEVLSNPSLTTGSAVWQFYSTLAPTTRDAFETDAAIQAGSSVSDDVSRSRHVVKRGGRRLHRWEIE